MMSDLYRAIVTRVSGSNVWVNIPYLHPTAEYGPMQAVPGLVADNAVVVADSGEAIDGDFMVISSFAASAPASSLHLTGTLQVDGATTLGGGATVGTGAGQQDLTVTDGHVNIRSSVGNDFILRLGRTTDPNYSFWLGRAGTLQWGDGTNPFDIQMFRDAADILGMSDRLRIYRTNTTDIAFAARQDNVDTQDHFQVQADGKLKWSNGATTPDAFFEREAAAKLKLSNDLHILGALTLVPAASLLPTRVASANTSTFGTTSPKTMTVSVQAGDLIVVGGGSENSIYPMKLPVDTAGNTYTQRSSVVTSGYGATYVWTATAATTASITITVDLSSGAGSFCGNVAVYRNSGGVGAVNSANVNPGAPSVSLTTTAAHSAVYAFNNDAGLSADGTTRTWRTVNGITPSAGNGAELMYQHDGTTYTTYAASWSDAGTAGANAYGLTAPASQGYAIIAVEILPSGSATTNAIAWGPGGGTTDTNLYRSSVGELTTDTDLVVGGILNRGLKAHKTVEVNNNSTTFTADNALTFNLPPGTYAIDGWIGVTSTAASGFQYRLNVTTGVAGTDWSIRVTNTDNSGYFLNNAAMTVSIPDANGHRANIRGTITISGATRTLNLEWAQVTAGAGPTFVMQQSWMMLTKLP